MQLRAFSRLVLGLVLSLPAVSAYANTIPILGSDLSTFAILGGAGVATNGTASDITGSVGACCVATAVTGTIPTISGGTVQTGGATATAARDELVTSMTALSNMKSTVTESSLGGLTLVPGVYSSLSTMDLPTNTTLTLDGKGDANALWVFQVGSALSTESGSMVNVINTGAGAGVYWVLKTTSGSASLGPDSTFAGNILAQIAITVGTSVTDSCGRLLTQTASVTLAGTDTIIGIGNSCSGFLAGSNGASGGQILNGVGAPLAPVPVPGTFALLLSGLLGMVFLTFRKSRVSSLRAC
jgi:hypothetical protein